MAIPQGGKTATKWSKFPLETPKKLVDLFYKRFRLGRICFDIAEFGREFKQVLGLCQRAAGYVDEPGKFAFASAPVAFDNIRRHGKGGSPELAHNPKCFPRRKILSELINLKSKFIGLPPHYEVFVLGHRGLYHTAALLLCWAAGPRRF